MAMTRKKRRMMLIGTGGALLVVATVLVSVALKDTIVFFVSPTELAAQVAQPDRKLRIGGLVAEGSWVRGEDGLNRFEVTDMAVSIPVVYIGIVPDLFAEGQGVVAEGYMRDGVFEAVNILARHDETYMPEEVSDALKASGYWQEEEQ